MTGLLDELGETWVHYQTPLQFRAPLLESRERDEAAAMMDASWVVIYPEQPTAWSWATPSRVKKPE